MKNRLGTYQTSPLKLSYQDLSMSHSEINLLREKTYNDLARTPHAQSPLVCHSLLSLLAKQEVVTRKVATSLKLTTYNFKMYEVPREVPNR
jgi:hypothetical protein